MDNKIKIFDTTLRDGEQSPGSSMSVEQKLQFALQLEKLNVDIIEAGFPVSSVVQFEGVSLIANKVKKPVIAALCRAVDGDIKAGINSLKRAKKPRIHTFIATSDIHLKYKLQKTKSEALKMAVKAIKQAKKFTTDVEFSAEDATRSDLNFLLEIVAAAINAGATTINLPDTVGYTTPNEYRQLLKTFSETFSHELASKKVTFSVHCHNDLGMAVANSLFSLEGGAKQIECSVNGIGERAGNASLEEVVMAINTRPNIFNYKTNIDLKEIYKSSQLLSQITGLHISANKAIVGRNAFAHESGIHQHGVLKNKKTYEIMTPASIGRDESSLVLGRHSGKHGLLSVLKKLGISSNQKQVDLIYEKFVELSDKKKEIHEADIIAISNDVLNIRPERIELLNIVVVTGNHIPATATVTLKFRRAICKQAGIGDGPVDAAYNTIDSIMTSKEMKTACKGSFDYIDFILQSYQINSLTGGRDAMADVKVVLEQRKKNKVTGKIAGIGYSTDIVVASAKAYIDAINNALLINMKKF